MTPYRPTGMLGFTIVWFGQIISLMGSAMTGFAVTIWAFEKSGGSATALVLVGFFAFIPQIIFAPVAGALVDRWNRKLTMMLSDLAAGSTTIILLFLFGGDILEIWHLCVLNFISGLFQTFQWPAYSAAISIMIPKQQYARASAMMGLAETGSGILSPILAGALLPAIGLTGILIIDIVTFSFAIGALLIIHVPQPLTTAEGRESHGSLLQESLFGFKYILKRRPLLSLQLVFFFGNFLSSFSWPLLAPYILLQTSNDSTSLGAVMSAGAIGGVIGGLIMTAWGGFKQRKVNGVLLGWMLSGFTFILLGAGRSLPLWIAAMFLTNTIIPLVNSSNQAIWQAKVPPDLQGRVFSIRRLIAQVTAPLAMLLTGPLADYLMEPAMASPNASLAPLFSWAVGTGPGTGIAVILITCGVLIAFVGLGGYLNASVRNAETLIPDHTQDSA